MYLQRLVFFETGAVGKARPDQALFESLAGEEAGHLREAEALARSLGVTFSASGAASEPGMSLEKKAGRNPWSLCGRPWTVMYFTANAPEAGTLAGPAGNQYSTGLSDRGDQFFIAAVTGTTGATTYEWGSVVRNFDGSTTNTVQGAADSGSFNRANAFLDTEKAANGADPVNPARYTHIAAGTILCGLRGEAFEENNTGGDVIEDATRGGTELAIQ